MCISCVGFLYTLSKVVGHLLFECDVHVRDGVAKKLDRGGLTSMQLYFRFF